jgi:hypothetical protein
MTALAAHPVCLAYLGQFLNRVISLTKFGFGQNNIAKARADVSISFDNLTGGVHQPNWRIAPICYTQSGGSTQ